MPLVAGRVLDLGRTAGMFTSMTGICAALACAVQFAPETFGRSIEAAPDAAAGETSLGAA